MNATTGADNRNLTPERGATEDWAPCLDVMANATATVWFTSRPGGAGPGADEIWRLKINTTTGTRLPGDAAEQVTNGGSSVPQWYPACAPVNRTNLPTLFIHNDFVGADDSTWQLVNGASMNVSAVRTGPLQLQAADPVWAPSGDAMAFIRLERPSNATQNVYVLYTVNVTSANSSGFVSTTGQPWPVEAVYAGGQVLGPAWGSTVPLSFMLSTTTTTTAMPATTSTSATSDSSTSAMTMTVFTSTTSMAPVSTVGPNVRILIVASIRISGSQFIFLLSNDTTFARIRNAFVADAAQHFAIAPRRIAITWIGAGSLRCNFSVLASENSTMSDAAEAAALNAMISNSVGSSGWLVNLAAIYQAATGSAETLTVLDASSVEYTEAPMPSGTAVPESSVEPGDCGGKCIAFWFFVAVGVVLIAIGAGVAACFCRRRCRRQEEERKALHNPVHSPYVA